MAKKIKKYKVGIDSDVFAVSIVEAPAIESDFVALAEQKQEEMFFQSDERHMLYGAALIPNKDIYRNNGEQEFYISFTEESIEKMSQEFMKQYRQNQVTLDHESEANDITIVESWLVEDSYRDKANALGINVPKGTWMIGMKVNQIDVWERVKNKELKGFSVESWISLEEFEKQNNNNMEINTNEEMFLDRIKNVFKEVLSSVSMIKKEEPNEIEPTNIELEAEATVTETPTITNETPSEPSNESEPINSPQEEQNAVTEPTVNESEPQNDNNENVVEPTVNESEPTEPSTNANNENVTEEAPKVDNHLEDLIASMREEIRALREMNEGLNERVKEMGKQPSAQPINVNAKPSASGINGSTYQSWRSQLESYLIG